VTSSPPRRALPWRALRAALLAGVAVFAAACGETPGDVLPDPRDGRSGIQVTGQVDGRQVAINDGLPDVNFSDCDLAAGRDDDLCVVTEDLSGDLVVLVVENPAVLVEGARVPIRDVPCADDRDCDEVADAAVVDVAFTQGDRRVRATGGTLAVEVAQPLTRYRGTIDLTLPGGTMRGTFDLVPRPEQLQ
jgi:hypothetical protein